MKILIDSFWGRSLTTCSQVPRTVPSWFLTICKVRDFNLLGNPCQCLVTCSSQVLLCSNGTFSVSVCVHCLCSCHQAPLTSACIILPWTLRYFSHWRMKLRINKQLVRQDVNFQVRSVIQKNRAKEQLLEKSVATWDKIQRDTEVPVFRRMEEPQKQKAILSHRNKMQQNANLFVLFCCCCTKYVVLLLWNKHDKMPQNEQIMKLK